jgi:hypothetical protein
MKNRYVAALGIMLIGNLMGCAHPPPASFLMDASPPPAVEGRSNIEVLGGDQFPILSWDLPYWSSHSFADEKRGLRFLADCGINVAAFVRPEHLHQVEKLRLRCIVAPQEFPVPWAKLSDQQIFQTVKKLVDESHGSPAVIGYFLADEPGEPDFAALGKAAAAVKRLAPGKLAYINLFPDYATLGAPNLSQLGTATYTEYLEKFVSEVHPQFLSYDNYRIEFSLDQKNPAIAASYYHNLLEVRRVAMEHDLPFWNIVSSNQILPTSAPPSPDNLLLQAYTTLAAGANGITWYTYLSTGNPGYANCPITPTGDRSAVWSYLKMVNGQAAVIGRLIRPLKSVGVYFTPPVPAAGLAALPGRWINAITCDAPLMVGEFIGPAGEKYAIVVNLNLRDSVKLTITPRGSGDGMQMASPVDGSFAEISSDHSLWLTAGQGALLKLP